MKTLYLLFFLVISVFPVRAYIDPGTGSMLFSLLTGSAVTLFFFLKNLIIKLKSGSLFFTGKKTAAETRGKIPDLVMYSEGKQYWNVFLPVIEELARREIPCVYYTSAEDDPAFDFETPAFIQKKFIGSGNAAYRVLNFMEARICLMTTPSLDIYQLKRSPGVRQYAHILHMVSDATTYRLFGLDCFDSVLLTGEYQKKDLRTLERLRGLPEKQLFVAGCTYLDVLSRRVEDLPAKENVKTVLVAPSWGRDGILLRWGLSLLEPLAKTSWRVIIRPHPQSMRVEKSAVEKLMDALKIYSNVEWNFDTENIMALSRSDVLISDFSGVVFDYAFLFNRPVLYPRFDFDKRPYDAGDIEEEAWVFQAVGALGREVDEKDFGGIEKILEESLEGENRAEIVSRLREEAWMYRGEAGKRTVDFLLSILDEIPENG